MKFPFQHLETAPDHIRVFRVGDKTRQTPQTVAVQWRKMTFGMKPFFICPRCNARRVFLYHDSLVCYCRTCAGLRFLSQRKRARTRLLIRSHRLRISLGDQTGKPGDPFLVRPYLQRKTRYNRTIVALAHIERDYLRASEVVHRDNEVPRRISAISLASPLPASPVSWPRLGQRDGIDVAPTLPQAGSPAITN